MRMGVTGFRQQMSVFCSGWQIFILGSFRISESWKDDVANLSAVDEVV